MKKISSLQIITLVFAGIFFLFGFIFSNFTDLLIFYYYDFSILTVIILSVVSFILSLILIIKKDKPFKYINLSILISSCIYMIYFTFSLLYMIYYYSIF